MPKQASSVLEVTKRGASIQFRALVNELTLLIELFPHLRDSYDPDELPVSFILKRDASRLKTRAARRRKTVPPLTKGRGAATRS